MTRKVPARGSCTLAARRDVASKKVEVPAREDLVVDPLPRCASCGVQLPLAADGVCIADALVCLSCARALAQRSASA
jgi:hypothetical protein